MAEGNVRLGRRRFGSAAAAMAGIGWSMCPARASTSWEAYTYLPNANQAGVKGLLALFDTLRSDTNGELVINLHLGGSLPINATSITPTVSDNIVQFGTDGFFSGNLPIAGLLRLPMLLRSAEEFATAEAIAAPFINAAYLKKGVVALGEYTYLALKLVGECGTDFSAWPSAKQFALWLCLAPSERISGGKVLSSKTRHTGNRAAALLRLAAIAVGRTDTALGAFYRRRTRFRSP